MFTHDANDHEDLLRMQRLRDEEENDRTTPAASSQRIAVSSAGDASEKQADAIAQKVTSGTPAAAVESANLLQVQPKQDGAHINATADLLPQLSATKGSGQALDESTRGEMEMLMGADLDGVNIHTGTQANNMNEGLNAKAFTFGQDIYFRNGQYNPASPQGKELLAHELVHTQQQAGAGQQLIQRQGHEPGQDYSTGTITAKGETYLLQADHVKHVMDDAQKHQLYFKQGDVITLISTSADKFWVEAKGTAHYKEGKTETDVADAQGWVSRRDTDMTLGMFSGLDIKDETSKSGAGGISYGTKMDKVSTIVLHQTDSQTAKGTLNQYSSSAKQGKHIGAQYLISETGEMSLVVPLNEKVGQVASDVKYGDRPVTVPKPKVADPAKVTDAEMKSTRELIDQYYEKLKTTTLITKELHDYWMGMTSQALYDTLLANNWRINAHPSNSTSIGIEVVQRHSFVTYNVSRFADDYTAARMALVKQRVDELVSAKKITEDKKKEVLRTEDKDKIQKSTDKKAYPTDASKIAAVENVDKEVYASLKKDGWRIGGHLIYQERVAPEFADLNQKQIDDFVNSVKAKNLSPDLKEQLLKTEKRNALAKEKADVKTSAERKTAIDDEIKGLNRDMFNFLASYDFMIYEDISGAQKYAMWLLVGKLVQNYNLDAKTQVLGHEEVNSKVFGEGQSQAEFIHKMTDFVANVRIIKEIMQRAPSAESRKQFQEKWNYEMSIIDSLDKGEAKNQTVLDFFNNFYTKLDAFNSSGALQFVRLYKNEQELEKK